MSGDPKDPIETMAETAAVVILVVVASIIFCGSLYIVLHFAIKYW